MSACPKAWSNLDTLQYSVGFTPWARLAVNTLQTGSAYSRHHNYCSFVGHGHISMVLPAKCLRPIAVKLRLKFSLRAIKRRAVCLEMDVYLQAFLTLTLEKVRLINKTFSVPQLCLYLMRLLHNMFHPIWPSSGALKLFGEWMNFCTQHTDPFLGNDREISCHTIAFAM